MSTPTLVIGNKNYSSWSLRPWLALRKAGIAFDEVKVFLDKPDTKKRILEHTPAGKVPALVTGGQTVWDSLAICEWAAEQVPALWPRDAADRAHARSISAEMHSGFMALRAALPMNIRATGRKVPSNPALEADIARILEIWAGCRATHADAGPWLFGEFSIADAMFAPVATRLRTYAIALDETAKAYIDTLFADPDFKDWLTEAEAEEDMLRIEEVG
ncbi:glutathione S-transferase family protein [Hwanghaeella grinnelliae]|uniref:glutathione S-transferase family protein n=1 Tax=Hwanghaeella grinnelliae TaxID=2500179 RepID=UPI00138695CF|nr:glutathione S-transferase family protein [Hwanghaeella grinnelliae]